MPERRDAPASETQLELSVIVPVFNQAETIADNLEVIRQCLQESLGDAFEMIVVSDGSIDQTKERVLEARAENVRTNVASPSLAAESPLLLARLETIRLPLDSMLANPSRK